MRSIRMGFLLNDSRISFLRGQNDTEISEENALVVVNSEEARGNLAQTTYKKERPAG